MFQQCNQIFMESQLFLAIHPLAFTGFPLTPGRPGLLLLFLGLDQGGRQLLTRAQSLGKLIELGVHLLPAQNLLEAALRGAESAVDAALRLDHLFHHSRVSFSLSSAFFEHHV